MNGGMFERYNEQARRSLFFARYEASVLGDAAIETHHLLLGLLKEPDDLVTFMLATARVTGDAIRHRIYERTRMGKAPLGTAVEIPFSTDAKQVLQHAFEEANILLHDHVGPEHLLLGLLRLDRGLAWDVLRETGLALAPVREALVMHVSATSPLPGELASMLAAIVPGAAPRPHRPGFVYIMTALDTPGPGRRPTDHSDVGGFTNVGGLTFGTRADGPPDGRVHSLGPISMARATLPQLALLLEGFLGAPVMVEDSGMSGTFDLELRGEYEDADALIAALREQLGLQLTKSL
jgi:hypothetical protein